MDYPLIALFAALGLIALGCWLAGRLLLSDEADAYALGREHARQVKLKRTYTDDYWAGFNEELYGHPDGPQPPGPVIRIYTNGRPTTTTERNDP